MKFSIKQSIRSFLAVSLLVIGVVSFSGSSSVVFAACNDAVGISSGVSCAKGDDQPGNLFTGTNPVFQIITNVLLFIIGAVSVIMLIIGGFKYVVSGGDSAQITSAKNTILYAIIGIVVAILAFAIVNFVVKAFVPGAGAS